MILYGLVFGVLAALLVGGSVGRLADINLRWGWVALVGIGVQLLLFSTPVGMALGSMGPVVYLLSTAAVLLAVLANARIPGMALIALGAVSNMAAILANDGYMPSTSAALAFAGRGDEKGYSNSSLVEEPALALLTDIFAVPSWVPMANVFSVGDVLIAVGLAIVVFVTMAPAATSIVLRRRYRVS